MGGRHSCGAGWVDAGFRLRCRSTPVGALADLALAGALALALATTLIVALARGLGRLPALSVLVPDRVLSRVGTSSGAGALLAGVCGGLADEASLILNWKSGVGKVTGYASLAFTAYGCSLAPKWKGNSRVELR